MSNENNHQQAQMLRGTAWLTASNFISRLLGAIYIIPWYIWMGTYAAKANGLFTMGYNIYAWFLLISTAGIPVAVAKQVAKYNTMREEEHSFALIRSFLSFMTGLGLVFALVLYLFFSLVSRFVRCGERPDSHHAEFGLGGLDFPIYECHSGLLPRDE